VDVHVAFQWNITQATYTGHSPVRAESSAGCGHSKIARVCAYYLYVLYVVAAADKCVVFKRDGSTHENYEKA